jgi:hypothetical protein
MASDLHFCSCRTSAIRGKGISELARISGSVPLIRHGKLLYLYNIIILKLACLTWLINLGISGSELHDLQVLLGLPKKMAKT